MVSKPQEEGRKKNAQEIYVGYRRKIEQLERHALRFDEGEDNYDEMAIILRVLTIDKPSTQSRSMLSTLGIATKIRVLSTCSPFNPKNLMPTNGLVIQKFNSEGASYVAPLGDSAHGGHLLNVDDWLNEIVFKAREFIFTRGDVIKVIAEKEGGAHFDREYNEGHYQLAYANGLGWSILYPDGSIENLGDPFPAAIRQIVFEVLKMDALVKAEGWLHNFG